MLKENLPGTLVDIYFQENGELGYIVEGDDEDCTLYWCEKDEIKRM